MTDPKSAAEIMYPNLQADSSPGEWHIELRSLPIFHRGHAFLALVDNEGRTVRELHGLGHSKHTGEAMAIVEDGGALEIVDYKRQADDDKKADLGPKLKGTGPISTVSTVASSPQQQMEKIWTRGVQVGAAVNAERFDYKSHDLAYELGSDGGEIQNSNSAAFTLGNAMGLDLSAALRAKGMTRTFSGWDCDLLDPNYKRYVAPPVFPVKDAS